MAPLEYGGHVKPNCATKSLLDPDDDDASGGTQITGWERRTTSGACCLVKVSRSANGLFYWIGLRELKSQG
jgi:hypothetical protein